MILTHKVNETPSNTSFMSLQIEGQLLIEAAELAARHIANHISQSMPAPPALIRVNIVAEGEIPVPETKPLIP